MSLSLAFNSARSSLSAVSAQIDVSARNTGGADMAGYSRKIASTTTTALGSAYIVSISRATDLPLYTRMIAATSRTANRETVLEGLNRLQDTVGKPDSEQSPGSLISKLTDALAQFQNAPDEPLFGSKAVSAAQDLARSLNAAANAVATTKGESDDGIADSVSRVNDLLKQFEIENDSVVKGTVQGADTTDAMDRRDSILSQLSEEMGITAVSRPGNDMVIYTDSGATLFETTPRSVTFQADPASPTDSTRRVFVDGIKVTGPGSTMPLKSGRIAGFTELRDDVAGTFGAQLDSMAKALMSSTAAPPPAPAGTQLLFSLKDPSAVPAITAANITVSDSIDLSTVDPDDLAAMLANLTGPQTTFDPAGGLGTGGTLADYGTASVGWLGQQRQTVSTAADSESAFLATASTALSNSTGVNMDQEYIQQMDLEHSYQASSKLIGVINNLYDTLLNIIR